MLRDEGGMMFHNFDYWISLYQVNFMSAQILANQATGRSINYV